ncbi:MAG: prolipoprotein diacylglyceryl transferase [Clostridiales bacterium GWF2_38_85]|nr:MAG: prolipoprotein diacylglyceryl transferase [Clostridiales bacterium GWF2_38_85]HBL83582.1 prolipoprotein diacylglyceryl transferase [Clostridiales bacterium]
MEHIISFPGLGMDNFTVNEVAFRIGDNIRIVWYAIIICIGILAAYFYAIWRGKHSEGFTEDDIINLVLFMVPISIIGARLLYVLTADDFWNTGDKWTKIFEIWNGGLAIYGALIFGAITIIVFAKINKFSIYKLLDCIAPAVMLGQIIGRWGNFMNGEAYGASANVEKLPWRMIVDGEAVHPTFLYESLWNLLGFILINIIYKKKKFDGQIFAYYAIWYGFGRGLIELLRTDSLMASIKLMSIFGIISIILGVAIIILRRGKGRQEDAELTEYLSRKKATAEGIETSETANAVQDEIIETTEEIEETKETNKENTDGNNN